MLKLAFLVLTLNAEGDVRMTLSERDSLAACEATKTQITTVLKDAGYTVLASICGETDLSLTPYKSTTPDDPLNRYKVTLSGQDHFQITPLAEGDICTDAPDGQPVEFCALSAQKVILAE
ncbi:hypothetical protein O2N63_14625 [Aliiroseovarius sp. KMU-50]|uniref:Uncharacterized protein n=1 Tax=Aliiroseovarius salicola TaxID=3009082 RepID=A0ABT4W5P8_9RHOB|nr:hypothetical protein [Aliiroseovarius sp. KMU-50]MDA5095320.1 hypothetical protein [Aliiroseovarius sp. KMU-50]